MLTRLVVSTRATLNSVRQETDAAGQVTAARSFDPYGVVLSGDGGGPFGYTGEFQDSASGLVFLRARYLQVADGRFITRDTWPGDGWRPVTMNPWLYSYNNPVKYADPSGRFAWVPVAIAGGAVIGGGIVYGSQVAHNWRSQGESKNLLAALTTDINAGSIVQGAAAGAVIGATVAIAAPVVVGMAGSALTGAGLLTGSTEVFAAGVTVSGASAALANQIFGTYSQGTVPTAGEPEQCRVGKLVHEQLGQVYLESASVEEQPFIGVDATFTDLAGQQFRPDVVNHATGEIVEFKPLSYSSGYQLREAQRQAQSYVDRLNELFGDARALDGASPYHYRLQFHDLANYQ